MMFWISIFLAALNVFAAIIAQGMHLEGATLCMKWGIACFAIAVLFYALEHLEFRGPNPPTGTT